MLLTGNGEDGQVCSKNGCSDEINDAGYDAKAHANGYAESHAWYAQSRRKESPYARLHAGTASWPYAEGYGEPDAEYASRTYSPADSTHDWVHKNTLTTVCTNCAEKVEDEAAVPST